MARGLATRCARSVGSSPSRLPTIGGEYQYLFSATTRRGTGAATFVSFGFEGENTAFTRILATPDGLVKWGGRDASFSNLGIDVKYSRIAPRNASVAALSMSTIAAPTFDEQRAAFAAVVRQTSNESTAWAVKELGKDVLLELSGVGLLKLSAVAVNGIRAHQASAAMAKVARVGKEGEAAVGLIGPKKGIRIPGANNLRFPDGLTQTTLSEVKNVAKQGYTKQIKDYVAFSKANGLTFDLYVRPSTKISSQLNRAILRGDINKRYIPGAK